MYENLRGNIEYAAMKTIFSKHFISTEVTLIRIIPKELKKKKTKQIIHPKIKIKKNIKGNFYNEWCLWHTYALEIKDAATFTFLI